MPFKVGVDVGGTFTDFLIMDERGKGQVVKTFTTPGDPSVGVLDGLGRAARENGVGLREFLKNIDTIVHGTTITTNAVLTGQGAKTGLLTTKGFRDILNMRRGLRDKQYDSKHSPPNPLVPRYLIQPIEERVNCGGEELHTLNEEDVRRAIGLLKAEGVEAVAVTFLFSFLNPSHEHRTREILQGEAPGLWVSLSSEVLPEVRLYERVSTTVLNAYVGPILANYLHQLQVKLLESGFGGQLLIMQSNGGAMAPGVARRFAANTLLSGPAGGPTAGLHYGRAHRLSDIITVDMGGTSFDACLVKNGSFQLTTNGEMGGYRIALPTMDIHTIGAGGGSIAWIDTGGLLRVGPKSAGAEPGPVCYGRGGKEPTVTDADLLLGYLDPRFFWGGGITLDVKAAENAMLEKIGRPLGMNVIEAAQGIFKIVNSNMAAAVRVVSVQRGSDPREFALVVAGGAGPIHAGMIAKELDIPLALIPRESSVFCAAGMLFSDFRHGFVRTYVAALDSLDVARLGRLVSEMKSEALRTLEAEGIPRERIVLSLAADLRYAGQFNEVEVPLPLVEGPFTAQERDSMAAAFHETHDALYGHSLPTALVELVNVRLKAIGLTEKPIFREYPYLGRDASGAVKGRRRAFFKGTFLDVPVYDGGLLGNGNELEGPAIVEHPTTTIIVDPDYGLACDRFGNYVMHVKGAARSLEELLVAHGGGSRGRQS